MKYIAEIVEYHARDGRHMAQCQGLAVTSANAEHDLCASIAHAGLPDGPIEFQRNGVPALSFRSVHKAAKRRITLGEQFPATVARKTAIISLS